MNDNAWSMISGRLVALLTGRVVWVDAVDGTVETEHYGWRDRWAIFGLHSSDWWWVRRWGTQPCGCVNNPITRHQLLICHEHAWGDDPEVMDPKEPPDDDD